MAITTYAELQTAVASWLARSDLTTNIPDFIALAEAKFQRELEVRQMEQRSTAAVDTTSTDPEFITLPTDFHIMRRLSLPDVTNRPTLEFLSPTQLNDMRSRYGDGTGQPQFFSVIGSELELLPTPDMNYTLEMIYRKTIPALSNSNTTNWLLTLAPDLYLYGSLREAATFIAHDDRIALWGEGCHAAIEELKQQSLRSSFGTGPISVRVSGPTP